MLTAKLGVIDWCVCVAYLVVIVGLALRSVKGQENNEDYFVGGRRMNWPAVGVSMFATSFSSISFLGLPQRGAYQDFSFYLTILFIPFVITPILWWVFVPLYVRLRVNSGYEYLGRRFGRPAQRLGSGLYCVYAIGWMGTMLYAVALTLQAVLGLSQAQYLWMLGGIGALATAYTALGGLKAVVWTDVLQGAVLGGTIVVILILAVGRRFGPSPTSTTSFRCSISTPTPWPRRTSRVRIPFSRPPRSACSCTCPDTRSRRT
jgi:SSS family solute:Na+ symporter